MLVNKTFLGHFDCIDDMIKLGFMLEFLTTVQIIGIHSEALKKWKSEFDSYIFYVVFFQLFSGMCQTAQLD